MSFAEGLLMGLAGGVAGAAGTGQDIMQKERESKLALEKETQLEQIRSDLLLKRSIALKEWDRDQAQRTGQAISEQADKTLANQSLQGLGEAGVGANVSAEDLQALRDNPEALAAYRNAGAKGLLNATPVDRMRAESDAAQTIGGPDVGKTYADRYDAERRFNTQQAQTEATNKRLDAQLSISNREVSLRENDAKDKKSLSAARAALYDATTPEAYANARSNYLNLGGDPNLLSTSAEDREVDDPLTGESKKTRTRKPGLDELRTAEFQAYSEAQAAVATGRITAEDANKRLQAAGYKPLPQATYAPPSQK